MRCRGIRQTQKAVAGQAFATGEMLIKNVINPVGFQAFGLFSRIWLQNEHNPLDIIVLSIGNT